MNSVETLENLCGVIDHMNVIIRAQAMELAMHDSAGMADEIEKVRREYADAIGERDVEA